MAGWLILGAIVGVAVVAPFVVEALRKPVAARRHAGTPGRIYPLSRGDTHILQWGPQDGTPIVLVHGLTTPAFVWEGIAPSLAAQGFRVIAYDHYGRGLSDRPRGVQDAELFNAHLVEVLEAMAVTGPVHLIGYSMGGAIVAGFAARYPDRVLHLTLIAPAGMQTDLGGLMRRAAILPFVGDWLMHAIYPRLHRKGTEAERGLQSAVPDIVDRQQDELRYRGFIRSVLASLRGLLNAPLEREHHAVRDHNLPVLAIWGREDVIIPLVSKDVLTNWNGKSRHVVIDGAGHGLPYTHADAVLEAVLAEMPAQSPRNS